MFVCLSVCLFVCVLLNQLNMAACIDLIFSMHSPIDPICALGYKKLDSTIIFLLMTKRVVLYKLNECNTKKVSQM